MSYYTWSVITGLFNIFFNYIGITGFIISFVVGILLCKFTNIKVVISVTLFCFFWLVLGILAVIAQNSPDMLWMPILFFPVTITMVCVEIVYYIIKWAIKKLKVKRNK